MSRPKLITVWELEMILSVAVSDTTLDRLREDLGRTETRETQGFVWRVSGARCEVRTEGDVFELTGLVERYFGYAGSEPTAFTVRRIRTEPVRPDGKFWQGGHARPQREGDA